MNLKDYITTIPDFPEKGIMFRDITTLLQNGEAFSYAVKEIAKFAKEKGANVIVGPEARGFLLGSMLATSMGCGFIPVRKKDKLPPSIVASKVSYIKEYGEDVLELPKLVNDDYKDKKFYIVDDIYATGNTMKAISTKIEELGGIVAGEGVIMNIKELNNNDDLFSLIDINEE